MGAHPLEGDKPPRKERGLSMIAQLVAHAAALRGQTLPANNRSRAAW